MTTLSAGGRDRLRFGIFMPTVSNSPNISHYKADQADWTFAANRAIGLAAEEVGFDFLFPVSRWRTIGGDIDQVRRQPVAAAIHHRYDLAGKQL